MLVSNQKEQLIKNEFERAINTRTLHLPHLHLTTFPYSHFKLLKEEITNVLFRLDLSYNYFTELPNCINILTNLRELWINNNPINYFPIKNILCFTKLEVLNISKTNINDIPCTIVTLKKLYDIDWIETPLAETLYNR